MKKIKKIFTLFIFFIAILGLISCETTNNNKAPNIANLKIEGTTLMWDSAVEGEQLSYEVSFSVGEKTYYMIVASNSYNFSKYANEKEITFTVCTEAYGEYGLNSDGLTITYKNKESMGKAPSPKNLKIDGTTLTWDSAVEGEMLTYVIEANIDGEVKTINYLGE